MKDMRIYVASLSDYNNGRLEGKWLDLADYSDASELMEAIQEMLDELTEKYKSVDGEVREEFAVHDYEGIPSTLASEYMGEQDFQQLYDIAEVADERGIPVEVLVERAGDTGSDDYQALADSLMFVVDGNDESDIVHEYEDQIGELGSDFWSNHIYIDDVTERVIYGEDVDRFREDILSENPDMDEDEAERQAEEMADEEAERREDLTTYLEDMGYGDSIPDFVSKDYEGAWKRSLSYDFDVINHDGQMYVFSSNYSLGGTILSGMIGAYIGYKVGRAKPQKKGFETEKKIGRKIKGALTKKKMARGGGVSEKITKSRLKAKLYKPQGDFFIEDKGDKWILHFTPKDASNNSSNLSDLNAKSVGNGYYGSAYSVDKVINHKYAKGGGVGKKLSKEEALKMAMDMGVDFTADFHSQSYGNELAELAKKVGYRKSPSASGSLGREFFYHLQKMYDKKKMARGGNVNTGRSWHQDRRMHNKSERYEKPLSSRKRQFAEGGNIFKGSRGKNQKVQNWYIKNYPTDDLGQELNDQITFDGLWRMMNQRYDFYDLIDVADSLVRERIFSQIAKIYGIDYDLVYNTWLKGFRYAKGGGIGFKGLSSKVAKRYEGKSVAPKYQSQYGTKYSKSEAKEVGDKVAGKVYAQQQGRKMAEGGGVDGLRDLRDEIKDIQQEIEFVSSDKSFKPSERKKYISELKQEIAFKQEKIRTFYDSNDKYAQGGGVGNYEMYDEQLYLDNDLKESILENDTLSTFIKERHFIRDKNGKLFMWIDWMDYDQFDKLANFLGYKYAKGGGVSDNQNKRFLDSIDNIYKQRILFNIANHYRITLEEALDEVTDSESENLYEYITDSTLRMEVYKDMKNRRYAEGGGVDSKRTFSIYELAFGQPYNFYNEEENEFIWSEPTKATLYTKEEALNKREELLKPRRDYYQRTGNNYKEIHIGDLSKKGFTLYAEGGGISGLNDLIRG
jgi:antirestriction protein